ncbi:hypothetical protein CBR_g49991 [Chara braunii]|uniref:glutathione transferase n=1 Tax=Chara braunii TaxID=69332 RepID=A0A388K5A4_CHABU|nr:hypothetical protein CBR_g49991 [Chara braunii]|eukprot:GBG65199.1 hypothetical protein CBR_g49991 [Chara braunii]
MEQAGQSAVPEPGSQPPPAPLILYSFYRSSCAWRVRNALELKGVKYEYRAVNIFDKEQKTEDFVRLNTLQQVPVLVVDNGRTIGESVAILEYLEEVYPEPRLLPSSPYDRAIVRQLVEIINSGTQPLQNLRVLLLVVELGGDAERTMWARDAIARGFGGFEDIIRRTAGIYCYGDQITLADVVLIPQLFGARLYGVNLDAFPTIQRVEAALLKHPAFITAHADNQPDTPPKHSAAAGQK